jgi:hypothetical protein
MTLFVLENTEARQHRKIFTLLGVDFIMTQRAWMNIPLMLIVGIVLAFVLAPADPSSPILIGIGYGILIMIASFCHGLGHIISSRIVGAPMTALVATATVYLTHYNDTEEYPSRIHVGRSIGGPVLNIVVGVIALGLYSSVNNHFLLFFGGVNLIFAVLTILPIPSVDGAVFFRELRNWKN